MAKSGNKLAVKKSTSSSKKSGSQAVGVIKTSVQIAQEKNFVKNVRSTSKISGTTKKLSDYANKQAQYNKALSKSIKGSTRLFGAPHQLLPHNDTRIGNNQGVGGLGQLYAEKIVMEAPIVYFKPGKGKFMPGQKSSAKTGMLNALEAAIKGDYSDLETLIKSESPGDDLIRYYGFEDDFSDYMSKVNLLCRFMAYFLGIHKNKVPWATHCTFGHYDWRYYKFKKTMNSKSSDMGANGKGVGTFISDVFEDISKKIKTDDAYVSFYVDANASFSESASNSTTQSVIKQYTDQVSSIAKEIQTISGISGIDAQGLMQSIGSSLDQYSQSISSNGGLSSFIRRITGTTGQLIQGANFMVPEIWSDSDYSRSYSIPITLSTPYGNKISWYINIGVPLCFILGLALPHGTTANTYTSPCLVQCFSQGWFNCGFGIVDSFSLDKQDWNAMGLPNEIKVSLNVKDLYSQLSLPKSNNALGFMQNTGMFEYLMVNSGLDFTVANAGTSWKVWKLVFSDLLTSKIQAAPYDMLQSLMRSVKGLGKFMQ